MYTKWQLGSSDGSVHLQKTLWRGRPVHVQAWSEQHVALLFHSSILFLTILHLHWTCSYMYPLLSMHGNQLHHPPNIREKMIQHCSMYLCLFLDHFRTASANYSICVPVAGIHRTRTTINLFEDSYHKRTLVEVFRWTFQVWSRNGKIPIQHNKQPETADPLESLAKK